MPDSLIIDWLNENQYRAYPLKNKGVRSFDTNLNLDTMILDANIVTDIVSTSNPVKLTGITISGGNCTIATDISQTFVISNYLSASYPQYIRNNNGSLLVVGDDIKNVTSNFTFTTVEFEESVITIFDPYWYGVWSVSFNGELIDSASMTFEAGYQFKITADEDTSTIKLGANMNYGIPIGCDEFFPGIDKDCNDIISYINGVTVSGNGSDMKFTSGSNIAIYNDPDNNRIYIGLNFESPDVCQNINERPLPNIL